MVEWIDSHCHLDGYQKKGELDAVLERAEESAVLAYMSDMQVCPYFDVCMAGHRSCF